MSRHGRPVADSVVVEAEPSIPSPWSRRGAATAAEAEAAGQSAPAASPAAIPAPSRPSRVRDRACRARRCSRPSPEAGRPPAHPLRLCPLGRVDADGTVYVVEGEGERPSVPSRCQQRRGTQLLRPQIRRTLRRGELLYQRVAVPEVTAKDVADGLKTCANIGDANVVGDLAALERPGQHHRGQADQQAAGRGEARAAAKAEAQTAREALVASAEQIAAVPVERVQWKTASATAQPACSTPGRSTSAPGFGSTKEIEAALWQRFEGSQLLRQGPTQPLRGVGVHARAGARATKGEARRRGPAPWPPAPTGRPPPALSSG